MTQPSSRDLEQLSTYLDGQLTPVERARLEARLVADPQLRLELDELRRTRSLLRRTPRRRAPRSFALTPKMAGLRPPVPRLVPAFAWTSAAAVLLFFCTFAFGLVNTVSLAPMAAAPKANAPALAAAPAATVAPVTAFSAEPTTALGLGGGPANDSNPAAGALPAATAPAQSLAGPVETATAAPQLRSELQTPATAFNVSKPAISLSDLQIGLLGLAVLAALLAMFVSWNNVRAFARRNKK